MRGIKAALHVIIGTQRACVAIANSTGSLYPIALGRAGAVPEWRAAANDGRALPAVVLAVENKHWRLDMLCNILPEEALPSVAHSVCRFASVVG